AVDDGVARGDAELQVLARFRPHRRVLGLRGEEDGRLEREGAEPFAVIQRRAQVDLLYRLEGVARARVRDVEGAGGDLVVHELRLEAAVPVQLVEGIERRRRVVRLLAVQA